MSPNAAIAPVMPSNATKPPRLMPTPAGRPVKRDGGVPRSAPGGGQSQHGEQCQGIEEVSGEPPRAAGGHILAALTQNSTCSDERFADQKDARKHRAAPMRFGNCRKPKNQQQHQWVYRLRSWRGG